MFAHFITTNLEIKTTKKELNKKKNNDAWVGSDPHGIPRRLTLEVCKITYPFCLKLVILTSERSS